MGIWCVGFAYHLCKSQGYTLLLSYQHLWRFVLGFIANELLISFLVFPWNWSAPTNVNTSLISWVINPVSVQFNKLRLRQMAAIFRRQFQMHFHEWKLMYFYSNFTANCSQGQINNKPSLLQKMAWAEQAMDVWWGDSNIRDKTINHFI